MDRGSGGRGPRGSGRTLNGERKGDEMLVRAYTSVTAWWNELKVRAQEEKGATAVEYALMVALIAVVIIAAVAFLGKAASNKFSTVGSAVDNP
jgi:pilus assembly protein Flp/PilA